MSRRANILADKSRSRSSKVLLVKLWDYLLPMKKYLGLVAFLTLFYTGAVTIQPILVQYAINNLLSVGTFASVVNLLLLYVLLSAVAWITQSTINWFLAIVQNDLVHRLRTDTFEKLVDADLSYHSQTQSGNVTSRVVNDTQEITAGITVFTTSATNLLVAVATLSVLFSISIWFGLISLLAIPTAYIITKVISSKGKERMLKVRASLGRVSGKLAENLAGVAVAKSFNQEKRTSNEIRKLNDETFEYFRQLGAMMVSIFPSITLVSLIMIASVLFVGGYLYTIPIITIGAIYLGTVMVRRFLSPILQLSNNITSLQTALAAMDRIVDILNTEPAVGDKPNAKPLVLTGGTIEFEHVSFEYVQRESRKNASKNGKRPSSQMEGKTVKSNKEEEKILNPSKTVSERSIQADGKLTSQAERQTDGHTTIKTETQNDENDQIANKPTNVDFKKGVEPVNKKVLTDVSFVVPGGSKTALIGHTGAGKSTITKLILRFYDPTSGSIKIDNQDLREVTLESIYNSVSLVTQEPYLFVGTVMENIKYGKMDATDEEVYTISRLVGAEEFIDALPQKYQTTLTESGKSLSAGQRQMITIVRTMLRDPAILILDEATSRLDAYSESLVQQAQNILFEGRTTLVIAHRLSTVRDVDQIVVIDDGKIIESGSHEELYAKKDMYYELYEMYYSHQGLKELAKPEMISEEKSQTSD